MGEKIKKLVLIVILATLYLVVLAAVFVLCRSLHNCEKSNVINVGLLEICAHSSSSDLNITCSVGDSITPKNPNFDVFENFKRTQAFSFRNDTNYVSVKFVCSASFPVTWVHFQNEWISRTTDAVYHVLLGEHIYFEGNATNIFDPTTFQYSAVLVLANRVNDVGQYICKSATTQKKLVNKSASMTIFKDPSVYHPYRFPLAGENITVWMEERHNGNVILPCYVSTPDVSVTLSKLVFDGSWENVSIGEGVTHFPEIGFVQKSGNQLSAGIYKCSSDRDVMYVTLHPGQKQRPLQIAPIVYPPANFTVDLTWSNETVVVSCCSGGVHPPNMKAVYCSDKVSCRKYLEYRPDLVRSIKLWKELINKLKT